MQTLLKCAVPNSIALDCFGGNPTYLAKPYIYIIQKLHILFCALAHQKLIELEWKNVLSKCVSASDIKENVCISDCTRKAEG